MIFVIFQQYTTYTPITSESQQNESWLNECEKQRKRATKKIYDILPFTNNIFPTRNKYSMEMIISFPLLLLLLLLILATTDDDEILLENNRKWKYFCYVAKKIQNKVKHLVVYRTNSTCVIVNKHAECLLLYIVFHFTVVFFLFPYFPFMLTILCCFDFSFFLLCNFLQILLSFFISISIERKRLYVFMWRVFFCICYQFNFARV